MGVGVTCLAAGPLGRPGQGAQQEGTCASMLSHRQLYVHGVWVVFAVQDAAAGMSDLESRLSRLEAKLSGVHNVAGKLVALEQMAAGLGVGIPDLEVRRHHSSIVEG